MDHSAALDPIHARDHLIAARARLDALTADVGGAQLFGPKIEIVNPFLWELGRVAWFQERWCLRARTDGSLDASILDRADALYGSSAVAHRTGWHLPLANLAETRRSLAEVRDRTLESLDSCGNDPRQICFADLSAAHEDMHCEALHYMRQTLSYPVPGLGDRTGTKEGVPMSRDARFAGGAFLSGALPGNGFGLESGSLASVTAVAAGDTPEGVRQLMGSVWEWTASDFLPYPGFKPDAREDYSQPWFGTRKVLRGCRFASPRRMLRATWRNFFTPDRADVFAGLRTCALEA